MFQKRTQQDDHGTHEINMTPLIDVSLVLVVMLLLATPLALESSIALRGAKKSARTAEEKSKTERVEMRVVSEDSVRVNRVLVARSDLVETLSPLIVASSDRIVIVTCADAVSHGAFVDAIDRAKLAGASQIAVTEK